MPYENIPIENAAAPISHDFGDYVFKVDLWYATLDDMALFDAETKTTTAQLFDFLDRVITGYTYRDVPKGPGVTGKGIPLPILMQHLMPMIGEGMKALQNPGGN
jgi:hypothetical protein